MLCPANNYEVTEAYNQLLSIDTSALDSCLNYLGSPPQTTPDGSLLYNACRQIDVANLEPQSEARRALVEQQVWEEGYNTNYTASWFLVRSAANLNRSGNLRQAKRGCGADVRSRNTTFGPLTLKQLDMARAPSSIVPLLGDGAAAGHLLQTVGRHGAGVMVVASFTGGPVLKATMAPPTFPAGTPREGPQGWWAVWHREVLQDYRQFAAVHRDICNVLFADGAVRQLIDGNRDGLLNNGFPALPASGFADSSLEIPSSQCMSLFSLNAINLP
jgi:prepilin-type processing-associated H-X9-DG protein